MTKEFFMLETIYETLIEKPNILIGAVILIVSVSLIITVCVEYKSESDCEVLKVKLENSKGKSDVMVNSYIKQAYNQRCR